MADIFLLYKVDPDTTTRNLAEAFNQPVAYASLESAQAAAQKIELGMFVDVEGKRVVDEMEPVTLDFQPDDEIGLRADGTGWAFFIKTLTVNL